MFYFVDDECGLFWYVLLIVMNFKMLLGFVEFVCCIMLVYDLDLFIIFINLKYDCIDFIVFFVFDKCDLV